MACFGPLRGASHDGLRQQWAFIFGIAGDVAAFVLFFISGRAFFTIRRDGAVGDANPYPWLAVLVTCGFWIFYGVPSISIPVMALNAFGAVVQLANLGIFQYHGEDDDIRDTVCIILVFEVLFTSVLATVIFVFVPQESKATAFGCVGSGCAVAMYAIPIWTMVRVYQTGNAQHMDLRMVLASFGNAAIWTVYAVLAKDRFALVPNVVGVVVGMVQMYLFFHFTVVNPPPPADGQEQ